VNGKFIVFEGIDGSGKSTQLTLIDEKLKSIGIETVLTREPTDGETGKMIRRCLSGEISADGETIGELFAADRLEHVKELKKLLTSGKWVLCDRYFLSSLAYQGECMSSKELTSINSDALKILKPDLTLYFDITPEKAAERMEHRGTEREIFEKLDYQKRVYERYKNAINVRRKSDNIVNIDASGDEKAVFEAAYAVVAAFAKGK